VKEYASLLSGEALVFDGLKKKDGTGTFSAGLALGSDGKWKFVFPDRGEREWPKDTEVLCPKSKKPVKEFEKSWAFPGLPGVWFNKVVAQRPVALEDYVTLVKKGKVGPLEGFVSSKGSKFSALLKIGEDKRVTFEFPPREGQKKS
jgi:hypothetical protein